MDKLLVLPGDGIGPSVVKSAINVLDILVDGLEIVYSEIGFSAYESTGQHLPYETLDLTGECRNILSGPVHNTSDSRSPLDTLKLQLDLYAVMRRFKTLSPDMGSPGMDVTLWASNATLGQDIIETRDMEGITINKYIRSSSYSRMMGKALSEMESRDKRRVVCAVRSDLLPESSQLFRDSFESLFVNSVYDTDIMNIDRWASSVVRNPHLTEFLICADLYSHVAAGLLAGMTGGNHLSPIAYVGDTNNLYIPGHMESFNDVPKDYLNPTSAIMAMSQAIFDMGYRKEADDVVNALVETYSAGHKTPELGGDLTTEEFTRRVISNL